MQSSITLQGVDFYLRSPQLKITSNTSVIRLAAV